MRVVAVRVEVRTVLIKLVRIDFAVMMGERQHLVPGAFDGARLMNVHMAGIGGHHAGVLRGDGIDDDLVGLRAADQKEDLGFRACACLTDFRLGGFADFVVAVAGILFRGGIPDALDDFRCRGAGIIVFERQHDAP